MTVGVAYRAAGLAVGTGLGGVVAIIAGFPGLEDPVAAVGETTAVRAGVGVDIVAIVALLEAGIDDPIAAASGCARDILAGTRADRAAGFTVITGFGDGVAVVTGLTLGWLHNPVSTITLNPIDGVAACITDRAVVVAIRTALGDGVAIVALLKGRLSNAIAAALGFAGDALTRGIADGAARLTVGAGLGGAVAIIAGFTVLRIHHAIATGINGLKCTAAAAWDTAGIARCTSLAVLRPIIALLAFDLVDPPIAAVAGLACDLLTATAADDAACVAVRARVLGLIAIVALLAVGGIDAPIATITRDADPALALEITDRAGLFPVGAGLGDLIAVVAVLAHLTGAITTDAGDQKWQHHPICDEAKPSGTVDRREGSHGESSTKRSSRASKTVGAEQL